MPEMQVGLSECSAPQARRGESGPPLATPAVAGAGWPCAASAYVAASCPPVVALPPEAQPAARKQATRYGVPKLEGKQTTGSKNDLNARTGRAIVDEQIVAMGIRNLMLFPQ
jgi:hypothetical protein